MVKGIVLAVVFVVAVATAGVVGYGVWGDSGTFSNIVYASSRISERDAAIARLEGEVHKGNAIIRDLEGRIQQRDAVIARLENRIQQRDTTITRLNRELSSVRQREATLIANVDRLERDYGVSNVNWIYVLESIVQPLVYTISPQYGGYLSVAIQILKWIGP